MGIVMIIVATKNENEAEKIADALLEKKLAACCNIIPTIKSSYWWEGKIEKNNESLMFIKTQKDLAERAMESIRENHSYDIPTIDMIDISKANKECIKWVEDVTRQQK